MRAYRDQFDLVGFDHEMLDLENENEINQTIGGLDFDVLINAAAFTNVDRCQTERHRAFAINATAPRILAEICRDKNAKLIHFSTDYVFDGEKREPYAEDDAAKPISVYGESKREGEKSVLETQDRHLVVRVSWVFGPDRPSFIDAIIRRACEEEHVDAVADKLSAPTYAHDIAEVLPHAFDIEGGILHFANAGECSWQQYGQLAIDCARSVGVPIKAKTVEPVKMADMKNWVARRPVYSVLSAAKFTRLSGTSPRTWREAVNDYIRRSYSKK